MSKKELQTKLETISVNIATKCGENGKLFGSITSKDVSEELSKQHGISIDKKKIVLADSIKETGTFNLDVKLYPSVSGKIKVIVTNK